MDDVYQRGVKLLQFHMVAHVDALFLIPQSIFLVIVPASQDLISIQRLANAFLHQEDNGLADLPRSIVMDQIHQSVVIHLSLQKRKATRQ